MAAAALTLAACSNDENMEMTDGPVAARITAGLSAPTTRAIGTNWNADEIGVWGEGRSCQRHGNLVQKRALHHDQHRRNG